MTCMVVMSNSIDVLAEFQSGIVYNMQGPKASAWNLEEHSCKWLYQNNFEKDFVNTTEITDPLPFFRRTLKGLNGTTFVKAANFKTKEATYISVKKYFEKHVSAKVIRNIKVGEVYLVKIRNSNDYAILKISSIKDDGSSLLYDGNNLDFIAFEYRLLKDPTPEAVTFLDNNFEKELQPTWDSEAEMIIYPNPVLDKIHVKFRKARDNIGWVVILENMNGDKVFASESIYETHWVNDFNYLPEGRYVLSILKNEEVYLQKVIDKNDSKKLSEVYP